MHRRSPGSRRYIISASGTIRPGKEAKQIEMVIEPFRVYLPAPTPLRRIGVVGSCLTPSPPTFVRAGGTARRSKWRR